ncbi:DUF3263 domain-containing protein [Cellulomonas fengjieae]|uniref:DUF3263 domain-containing protein n=1 Tax=Cellulomonas fengjieae TaxID=2819978 RepID=A0ABS3SGV7_9CELL|nr:DUF3263 domain-containing protein [Cellulomonas fengjieae]MBO3084985.1 DUF3263 domain-containing protein [Cellulomonas fengjieae]MBO3100732.1 DUF3263 domain-containing protein [Cellulomonas fengjieae]QVI66417.1 DUF3263 domain-containing protein [Cellulomonas fengjieae]
MDAATITIGSLPQAGARSEGHAEHGLTGQGRTGHGLSERDEQVLAFERQWWKYAGAKESAIRELFDMSATRYYQVLNALIDDPAALAHDPMLIKRLRRMRSSRQRARTARRLGDS